MCLWFPAGPAGRRSLFIVFELGMESLEDTHPPLSVRQVFHLRKPQNSFWFPCSARRPWQDRLIRYGDKGRQLTADEHRSLQWLGPWFLLGIVFVVFVQMRNHGDDWTRDQQTQADGFRWALVSIATWLFGIF